MQVMCTVERYSQDPANVVAVTTTRVLDKSSTLGREDGTDAMGASIDRVADDALVEATPSADPSLQRPASSLNVSFSKDVDSILKALCGEEPNDTERIADLLNQDIFASKPIDDDAIVALMAMESACPVSGANILADVVRDFDVVCTPSGHIKSAARAAGFGMEPQASKRKIKAKRHRKQAA